VLELVDYNMVIPHRLEALCLGDRLGEEEAQKAMLLCELLMVKDSSIFLSPIKLPMVLDLLKPS
jgi:hypothetical protein